MHSSIRYILIASVGLVLIVGCKSDPSSQGTVVHKARPAGPPPCVLTLASAGLPVTGMWKCDPVFGDVNDDGHMDLAAIPRLGNGPVVWLGDGQGNWLESARGLTSPKHNSCGGGVAFGDANNDGLTDLLVADHCHGLFVYLGDGQGGWREATTGLAPTSYNPDVPQEFVQGAEDLDIGDINRDGNLDIVSGASDHGGVRVYLGDGTGSNWRLMENRIPSMRWANRVQLHDIDKDGYLDVIAACGRGPHVWLNIGGNGWQDVSEGLPRPMLKGIYSGLEAGDVNGDGLVDLAVANWIDGPEVYIQRPGMVWEKSPDVFPQMLGGAVGLTMGDMDMDGHLDMVVTGRLKVEGGYSRGAYLLKGDGKGGWSYIPNSGLPPTGLAATPGVSLGDFDSDGVLDVVLGSGLIVESAPGRREPVIPERLMVWRNEPTRTARLSGGGGKSERGSGDSVGTH